MSEVKRKNINKVRRARRIRSNMTGTATKPRLSVKVSTTNVSAQLINDEASSTIAAATSIGAKEKATMTEKATKVGAAIAAEAKKKKITQVVFDRGNKQYHGRVKALADAARENGLEF